MSIIQAQGATCSGVAVGLDRQERGRGELSAIQEIEQEYQLQVISIINLEDLINFLQSLGTEARSLLQSMEKYREEYGVSHLSLS